MAKRILVTGGNAGIGFALCKQLVLEKKCFVYMGSRSEDKGKAAVQSIVAEAPAELKSNIVFVQLDVTNEKTIEAAAATAKTGGPLYAIVNNAGTGLQHGTSEEAIVDTNLYGPKRVCDTFIPLLEPGGRIVNVGSGAGPIWMRNQDVPTKKLFTNPDVTWEEIDAKVQAELKKPKEGMGAYGYTKAALTAYTMFLAKSFPKFVISCITPGFIDTAIVKGWGATKPPEEGTVSIHHCLWNELPGSGYFWGSDAKRSQLCVLRNPGEPEYNGEPEV
mmetsp:Transcript_76416/g.181766  ORF Transcript_76416/g.181766 Transcript_76416/m.181766 type:complete len:275 (+) Transcript_76416:60-884(+)